MLSMPENHASKKGAGKTRKNDHHREISSKTTTPLNEVKQFAKERELKRQA